MDVSASEVLTPDPPVLESTLSCSSMQQNLNDGLFVDSQDISVDHSSILTNTDNCYPLEESSVFVSQSQEVPMDIGVSSGLPNLQEVFPSLVVEQLTADLKVVKAASKEPCSGANVIQPAPTDCAADKVCPVPLITYGEQANCFSASLGVSGASFGTLDTAGLLNERERLISPSQELLSNEISSLHIQKLNTCKKNAINSNINISFPVKDFNIVLQQQSSNMNILPSSPPPSPHPPQKKILHPKQDFSEYSDNSVSQNTLNKTFSDQQVCSTSTPTYSSVLKDYLSSEDSKKQTTHTKITRPPGNKPTLGASPECGVLIERLDGYSLDTYAWAVTKVLGKPQISYIGRDPRDDHYILIFLKTPSMANQVVDAGVWIGGKWMRVSHFQQPAIRLTVSCVMPYIPDQLIIDSLSSFGKSVYSELRCIPSAVRHQTFKGSCSFRREMYLIKSSPEISLPDSINVRFLGVEHKLTISQDGPKCFLCGSLLHTASSCKDLVRKEGTPLLQYNIRASKHEIKSSIPGNSSSLPTVLLSEKLHGDTVIPLINQASPPVQQPPSTTPKSTRDYYSQCSLTFLPPLKKQGNINSLKEKKTLALPSFNDVHTTQEHLRQRSLNTSHSPKTSTEIDNHLPRSNLHSISTRLPNKSTDLKDRNILNKGSLPNQENQDMDTTVPNMGTKISHSSVSKQPQGISLIPGCLIPSFGDEFEAPSKKRQKQPVFGDFFATSSKLDTKPLTQVASKSLNTKVVISNNIKAPPVKDDPSSTSKVTGCKGKSKMTAQAVDIKTGILSTDDSSSSNNNNNGNRISNNNKNYNSKCSPEGLQVIREWCENARALKPVARRKLAASFLSRYPNLVNDMELALEPPKLFKSSTSGAKKIQEFLTDARSLMQGPRLSRVHKRRQDVEVES